MKKNVTTSLHYPVGTVVFTRTHNTVTRNQVTSIVIDKDGLRYIIDGYYYKPERVFETAEEAFKDE